MPPLAFSNLKKNNNMEFTFKDVTQEEYDTILRWKSQISYTQDELMGMVNMNRKYVNPRTPSCLSCQGSMRTTKGELMSWFMENQEAIKTNLESNNKTTTATVIETDVKLKSKKKL